MTNARTTTGSPRRGDRTALAALLLALLATGCPRGDTTASHAAADAAAEAGPPSGDVADGGAARDGEAASGDAGKSTELASALPWSESIRLGKWSDAERAIAALPASEQNAPEVRYARARVAIALGKHADAIRLLDKLEDDLPLMRDLVAKTRAEAELVVGPREKAAEWLASRTVPSAWLTAADAYDAVGDEARARSLCDRVVAADHRTRAQEEHARALRMRIVRDKEGDAAAAASGDAHWLAVHALDDAVARDATALLAAASPPRALDGQDLLARSRALADASRTDDALRAAERAASVKSPASPLDVCRARAEALYQARTRYPEAALAYRSCAALGGAHALEDAFLSARAFSRADRDGDALAAFQAIVQRSPKTVWAEQASFHIARTKALAGSWRDAAKAFDAYAKDFPNGRDRREAARYRAISHLMAQDFKTARKLLEELAGNGGEGLASSRWANLAALAALRDGDRTQAIARWTEIARGKPLTWPALVARARLAALSAPLPLTIDPAETGDPPPPVDARLPPPADVLHRIGLDADAEEALREREGVVVARSGGRGTEALCAVYAELDRAKRRYQVSLGIPGRLLDSAPGPKNRWAWDCAFPRPHKATVHEAESAEKLPGDIVWAVMRQESAFDPAVVSPAGAVGLMQLMPRTAKLVATSSGEPFTDGMLKDPEENVTLGAHYLRGLVDALGGDVPLAIGAYNAGPEAIERWEARAKGEPLDVFVETIPFVETRGYVVRVMGNLARYGFLERGERGVPRVALEMK